MYQLHVWTNQIYCIQHLFQVAGCSVCQVLQICDTKKINIKCIFLYFRKLMPYIAIDIPRHGSYLGTAQLVCSILFTRILYLDKLRYLSALYRESSAHRQMVTFRGCLSYHYYYNCISHVSRIRYRYNVRKQFQYSHSVAWRKFA